MYLGVIGEMASIEKTMKIGWVTKAILVTLTTKN
jgi:hypothetical protein